MAQMANTFIIALLLQTGVLCLEISLRNDGPAVRGSNITITATVEEYDGENLKFVFKDDGTPQHYQEFVASSNTSVWTVEYSRDLYEAGEYTVHVDLKQKFFFPSIWYIVASATTTFNLTETLNGDLVLRQNNIERPNLFVAVNQTVTHQIKLPDNELAFLKRNASSVVTYWFIDCMYIDQTPDMSLSYMYKESMQNHLVDVLVVADHQPLPPLTTTTTTTTTPKPTTEKPTTKPPASTTSPAVVSSTTKLPSNETEVTNGTATHKVAKRAAKTPKAKFQVQDAICQNTGIVPIGEHYTYGHYKKTISVREPISSVNITGTNWLQHGDLMNLQVKFTGTPPFDYCTEYKVGTYNVTGNETCAVKTRITSNEFPLVHYFSDSDQHTVIVIIENEVGKTVSRAAINIYKVTVHSQLSVIVVPVAFCLLAVILVVFGVAYYQHRARYTVEVADFDFGQQAHLDYKTFTERLRDSFRNAFNFRNHDDLEPLTNNTSSYNTME